MQNLIRLYKLSPDNNQWQYVTGYPEISDRTQEDIYTLNSIGYPVKLTKYTDSGEFPIFVDNPDWVKSKEYGFIQPKSEWYLGPENDEQ